MGLERHLLRTDSLIVPDAGLFLQETCGSSGPAGTRFFPIPDAKPCPRPDRFARLHWEPLSSFDRIFADFFIEGREIASG